MTELGEKGGGRYQGAYISKTFIYLYLQGLEMSFLVTEDAFLAQNVFLGNVPTSIGASLSVIYLSEGYQFSASHFLPCHVYMISSSVK